MDRPLRTVLKRLTPRHTKALELVSANSLIAIAGMGAFESPELSAFFGPIRSAQEPYVWLGWICLLGLGHLGAIALSSPTSGLRALCVALSSSVWLYAFSVAALQPAGLAVDAIFAGMVGLYLVWAVIRLRLEAAALVEEGIHE